MSLQRFCCWYQKNTKSGILVLGTAPLCLNHCLHPPWHTFNQFLTHLPHRLCWYGSINNLLKCSGDINSSICLAWGDEAYGMLDIPACELGWPASKWLGRVGQCFLHNLEMVLVCMPVRDDTLWAECPEVSREMISVLWAGESWRMVSCKCCWHLFGICSSCSTLSHDHKHDLMIATYRFWHLSMSATKLLQWHCLRIYFISHELLHQFISVWAQIEAKKHLYQP